MAGYGLPLFCPTSLTRFLAPGLVRGSWVLRAESSEFSMLKVPGERAIPCPYCGSRLVAMRRRR